MKKHILVGCACFCRVYVIAIAQQFPPEHHSLSLEVKNVSAGSSSSSDGAGKNTVARERIYDIEVRNLASSRDSVTIEWYFFAKRIVNSTNGHNNYGEPYISDSGQQVASVGSGQSWTLSFRPKSTEVEKSARIRESISAISGNTVYVNLSLGSETRGNTIAGWLVRLLVDGKVAALKASSPSFEELGRDAKRLKAMLPPPPPSLPRGTILLDDLAPTLHGKTSAEVIQLLGKPDMASDIHIRRDGGEIMIPASPVWPIPIGSTVIWRYKPPVAQQIDPVKKMMVPIGCYDPVKKTMVPFGIRFGGDLVNEILQH